MKCPRCGSKKTARILYGLPDYDEKLKKDEEAGKVIIAGCCKPEIASSYHCYSCKKEFGTPPLFYANNTIESYPDVVTEIQYFDGGYFGPSQKILIKREKGKHILTVYPDLKKSDYCFHREMPSKEWNKLLKTLYGKLYLHEWKKSYIDPDVLDGEQWSLSLKLKGNRKRNYSGSNAFPPYWKELQNIFNSYLEEADDPITHIEVTYHRLMKVNPGTAAEMTLDEKGAQVHTERLVVDGPSDFIVFTTITPDGKKEMYSYQAEGIVSSYLQDLHVDALSHAIGNPPDALDDPYVQRDYEIRVQSKHGHERVMTGSFDRYGLPYDWQAFAHNVSSFLSDFHFNDIFNFGLYSTPKRRKSDLIFCRVKFEKQGPTYTYLADTDDYKGGDKIIVPVGEENRETVATIESIEYRQPEDAPFPLDKIKHIIRKYEKTVLD